MTTFYALAAILGAASVLTTALAAINKMSAQTDHRIRAAYIMIALGAFGEVVAVFGGHAPGMAESVFLLGVGFLNFIDRRERREIFTCEFCKHVNRDQD